MASSPISHLIAAIPAASVAVPAAVGAGDVVEEQGPPSMDGVELSDLSAPPNATQGDAVEVEATVDGPVRIRTA